MPVQVIRAYLGCGYCNRLMQQADKNGNDRSQMNAGFYHEFLNQLFSNISIRNICARLKSSVISMDCELCGIDVVMNWKVLRHPRLCHSGHRIWVQIHGATQVPLVFKARSMRRSGISHISATRMYRPKDAHCHQKARGMARAYRIGDNLPFQSLPMACLSSESGPWEAIISSCSNQ